jgi:uncharacterized protein YdaU (DUF1376 family)
MPTKRPFIKFSPADWVIHTRPLSLAAKGAWIDLLCIMWTAQNRGVLQMNIEGYARAIGATVEQTGRVIAELIASNTCENSTEPDGRVTLISRRMVVEEEVRSKREADAQAASNPKPLVVAGKVNRKVNLRPNPAPKGARPDSEQEVVEYCKSLGVPDGAYFWHKWMGDGFRNRGKPMKDWRATIRSWKAAGYLPSQKQHGSRAPAISHVAQEGKPW